LEATFFTNRKEPMRIEWYTPKPRIALKAAGLD